MEKGGSTIARKRYKPEEIVNLLRQAEALHGQGLSMADAIRERDEEIRNKIALEEE